MVYIDSSNETFLSVRHNYGGEVAKGCDDNISNKYALFYTTQKLYITGPVSQSYSVKLTQ